MTSSRGVGLAAPEVVLRFKGPVVAVGSRVVQKGKSWAGLWLLCALPAKMGLQSEDAKARGAYSIHSK